MIRREFITLLGGAARPILMFAILGVDALRIKLRACRIFDLRAVFFENCHVLIGQFRRIKVLKRPARRHDPY
jgi:hypothetical protein